MSNPSKNGLSFYKSKQETFYKTKEQSKQKLWRFLWSWNWNRKVVNHSTWFAFLICSSIWHNLNLNNSLRNYAATESFKNLLCKLVQCNSRLPENSANSWTLALFSSGFPPSHILAAIQNWQLSPKSEGRFVSYKKDFWAILDFHIQMGQEERWQLSLYILWWCQCAMHALYPSFYSYWWILNVLT